MRVAAIEDLACNRTVAPLRWMLYGADGRIGVGGVLEKPSPHSSLIAPTADQGERNLRTALQSTYREE